MSILFFLQTLILSFAKVLYEIDESVQKCQDNLMKLTVIIPAAGKGLRLNLPYSKEIMRINRDQALID